MITLALAQLVYFVCLEAPFTGGENGLQGVPRGSLFGRLPLQVRPACMYYLVLAVFAAAVRCSSGAWCIRRSARCSRRSARTSRARSRSATTSIATSCWRSCCRRRSPGSPASLKALVLGFATLSDVQQSNSGEVILMTLLGGTGTFFGPVVGAAIVVTLQEYLSDLVGGWVTVIIGAMFVACVLAFRRGIVGTLAAYWRRRGSV